MRLFNKVIGLLRQYAGGRLFVAQDSYVPPEVYAEWGSDLENGQKRSKDNQFDFRRDVIYDQKVEWTEENSYNDEDE